MRAVATRYVDASEQLAAFVTAQDVERLAKTFFDAELTDGQARIVRAVAFLEHRRLAICAFTRYGKTWAVAVGLAILIIIHPRARKIRVVSATRTQAMKLRSYFTDLIISCPLLQAELFVQAKGAERLRKEVSRNRLTCRSGHEVSFHTAHGEAKGIMGEGGDVVVVDESALIEPETYRSKVSRMLGDAPDSCLIELSNPWSRDSHFFNHWMDDKFETIHVGYEQGLVEDRITQTFVDEQRHDLTTTEFQILYESVFPDQAAEQLIPWSWIERAFKGRVVVESSAAKPVERWGLDVAEGGGDFSVLSHALVEPDESHVQVTRLTKFDIPDTMKLANAVHAILLPASRITVDATGLGSGVAKRLRELGHAVREYRGAEQAMNPVRHRNRKAEVYMEARDRFQDECITVPDTAELRRELPGYRLDVSTGRNAIWVESDKSPDFGDSVVLAAWSDQGYGRSTVVRKATSHASRRHEPGALYGVRGR